MKIIRFDEQMKQNENPKKSRFSFLNPGIKNIGKSRPEKSRDPGIWKNPGIEILDPVRAWRWHTVYVYMYIYQRWHRVPYFSPVGLAPGALVWMQGRLLVALSVYTYM